MATPLIYLGERSSFDELQDCRRLCGAKHCFGWMRVDYPMSKNQRVMVAWVPGRDQREFGMWPVYGGDQKKRDLGGLASWGWNGNAEKPTLKPSIRHLARTAKGDIETLHGFVTHGEWEPC